MKLKQLFILTLACILYSSEIIPQTVQMFSSKDGNIAMLSEIGAVLREKSGWVEVEMMPPARGEKEGDKNVDLKKGDKILMVNGKKIKTAKDVTTIYEALKTGEEFKMGISRDDKMHMVSFKKGDAKVKGAIHQETIKMDGKSGNIFPTLELGFILEGKKDKLNIMKMMPGAPEFITKAKIAEGDELIKINKKSVKSIGQFTKEFTGVITGEELEITFLKNGKEITVSGKKPKSKGKVIIK